MERRKKLTGATKGPKGVAGMGSLMSQGMSALAAKNLMNKIRENKPRGRITQLDIKKAKDMMERKPRKMPSPKTPGTRMDKQPRKMPSPKDKGTRPLGPLRSIRERAKQSRLVGGKSKFTKPKR